MGTITKENHQQYRIIKWRDVRHSNTIYKLDGADISGDSLSFVQGTPINIYDTDEAYVDEADVSLYDLYTTYETGSLISERIALIEEQISDLEEDLSDLWDAYWNSISDYREVLYYDSRLNEPEEYDLQDEWTVVDKWSSIKSKLENYSGEDVDADKIDELKEKLTNVIDCLTRYNELKVTNNEKINNLWEEREDILSSVWIIVTIENENGIVIEEDTKCSSLPSGTYKVLINYGVKNNSQCEWDMEFNDEGYAFSDYFETGLRIVVTPKAAPAPVPTTEPSSQPTPQPTPVSQKNTSTSTAGITKVNTSKNGTATVTGVKKNAKKVTVSTVDVNGVKYAVTAIAKNAFKDTKATEVTLKYAKKNITIKKDAFKKSKVKTLTLNSFTKASQIKMDKNALKSSKISAIKVSKKIYNNKKQKAALIKTLKKAGLKKYKLKKI